MDMYNIKYINSLIISFISKYGMVIRNNNCHRIIEYESRDELLNQPIINIIECIVNFIKEKDIKFNN